MRKQLLLMAVSVALGTMASASAARATVYDYSFLSFDNQLSLSGTMTVDANNVITGMTGEFSGLVTQTVTGVTSNPNGVAQALSPDARFYYDNVLMNGNPLLDVNGVLFTTAENSTGYWNLWGTGQNSYALWESASGSFPVSETGQLQLTPETVLGAPLSAQVSAPAPKVADGGAFLFGLGALLLYSRRRRSEFGAWVPHRV